MNITKNKKCNIKINDKSYNDISAEEMFKKLGYKKVETKFYTCQYRKIVKKEEYYWQHNITFDNKHFLSDKYTSVDLLLAINKQMEELEWLND